MTPFRHHLQAVLLLGLPLAGSYLAQLSIGITDTVMVGWYGVEELAALSLATSYYFVLFLLGSGFGIAVMPMVAAAIANDDRVQVRRVTRMGVWMSALTGLACIPFFWFSDPIFLALGQQPDLSDLMQTYLRIAGWSMPFFLIAMVFKSHLSALEYTQIVLWSTLAAAGLNVFVNWILIFGNLGAPELGLRGAAIASLGTNFALFLFLAAYAAFARDLRSYAILARAWRPDWEAFGQVFRLGLPIGLTMLAESGLFTASAFMMGWISEEALAVHGIALQIAAATFMIHLGLSSAATVRAGNAFGQGDTANLRRGALAALVLSLALVGITIALFLGIPDILIGLFLDPNEPDRDLLIAMGVSLLAMAALFQLADAMQVMALGFLRGVQDTKRPMIYAVISYWVIGVPASYVLGFPLGLGGVGIWLGMAFGLSIAAVTMMARFWWGAAANAPHPVGAD